MGRSGRRRCSSRWFCPISRFSACSTYRPLLDNVRLSFFDWNISSPTSTFIGFDNYVEWFGREDSWLILRNTAVFTVSAVVGSMVLGLALALLLDQRLVGRGLVRSAVFAPFVIAGAAIGVAFQFIFDPRFGMVSALLTTIGLPVPDFYQDPDWALAMITITYIWKNLGYSFVIYLAALQAKPAELYEAAEIDGASRWTTFRRVTLPMLRPTTFFLSITVMLIRLDRAHGTGVGERIRVRHIDSEVHAFDLETGLRVN